MQFSQQSKATCEARAFHNGISRTLREARAISYDDPQLLCRALRGAFPTLIAGAIKELALEAVPKPVPFRRLSSSPDLDWPEPHPADFDWRFDRATAKALARLTSAHGRVLCFGTPTVYEAIAALGGRAHLIDCNPFIATHLTTNERCSFQISDLQSDLEIHGEFDAAVLDPPWYPEYYYTWLARAVTVLRRRHPTSLYITLFRELTRPAARSERAELLSKLNALGIATVLDVQAVYQTPRLRPNCWLNPISRRFRHGVPPTSSE